MDNFHTNNKIPVGISSCLLGERVRYDGGHKNNSLIKNTLSRYFEFRPFCPEVAIGLGVPRPTVHLVKQHQQIRCVATADPDRDITEQLVDCANQQTHWHKMIYGYIFKKNSPSCGPRNVKVHEDAEDLRHGSGSDENAATGAGIYARELIVNFPHLPVEDEDRLSNSVVRANFVERVVIYQRWQRLLSNELRLQALSAFHHKHQHIFIKHHKQLAAELEGLLSAAREDDIEQVKNIYIERLTNLLRIAPVSDNS